MLSDIIFVKKEKSVENNSFWTSAEDLFAILPYIYTLSSDATLTRILWKSNIQVFLYENPEIKMSSDILFKLL